MKIKTKNIRNDIRLKCLDALYTALDFAKENRGVKSFISDVLTESEKIMIGRRILIARELLIGRSYRDIVMEMGVGLDTVYKVRKWLGGRHKGIERFVENIRRSVKNVSKNRSGFLDYYPTSGLAEIKRRYKGYYWLSNFLDEINRDEISNKGGKSKN